MMEIIIVFMIVIMFMLGTIIGQLGSIYSMVQKTAYDPMKPVNQYGEGIADAIQNGIVRGQRGISTYET